MSFDYDRRFVYPTQNDAAEAIERQADRTNLVLGWLHAHKAPERYHILTICNPFPSVAEPMKCMNYLRFEGTDDDGHPAVCMMNLFHALSNPFVTLADLSFAFGSADPQPQRPWNRKPSQVIVIERWIEPEPWIELPPVPQPFGPHPDQFDDECMLSNSSDQFMLGAQWTKADGTLWQKEEAVRTRWGVYRRWRQISNV